MDTEVIATAAFKLAISKTALLNPFVNEKDKEPSWDGHVYIYSDKKKTKENIKRVPVQVKGKAVNRRKVKEHITHDIDYDDLTAYLSDGGAIYVVVYIDKTTGEPLQIYYISLLPEKIKSILKKDSKGKAQRFKKFPSNKTDIEDLFLTFHANSKRQVSFAKNVTIPPDVFAKKRDFTGFSFNLVSSNKPIAISDLPKYLEGKDLSLYGHLSNVDVPIPVSYFDEIHDLKVSESIYFDVTVADQKFYDHIKLTYLKDSIVISIGTCVKVTYYEPEVGGSRGNFSIEFRILGTLNDRIIGIQFISAAFDYKSFSIGRVNVPFDATDSDLELDKIRAMIASLDGYVRLKKTLDLMNVKKEFNLDHCSTDDFLILNDLIVSILDNKPINGNVEVINKIVSLKIGNLNLCVVYSANGGGYIIKDLFSTHLVATYSDMRTGESIRVSQFFNLKAGDFVNADNLNLEFLLADYKSLPTSDYVYDDATYTALELIKAYDLSKDIKYLDIAEKFYEWLEDIMYLPKDILLINRLQIKKRRGLIEFSDKADLIELIKMTDNSQLKCCAFLLLDEQAEAQKILNTFDANTKQYFEDYPIYYFYKHVNSFGV